MVDRAQVLTEATLVSLLRDLETLAKAARNVRVKLLKIFPATYGSDLWWEKSDQEAFASIKEGRGKKFKTYEEAVKYLTD